MTQTRFERALLSAAIRAAQLGRPMRGADLAGAARIAEAEERGGDLGWGDLGDCGGHESEAHR